MGNRKFARHLPIEPDFNLSPYYAMIKLDEVTMTAIEIAERLSELNVPS